MSLRKLNSDDLTKKPEPLDEAPAPVIRDAEPDEPEGKWLFDLSKSFTDEQVEILFPKYALRFLNWETDRDGAYRRVKVFTEKMRLYALDGYRTIKNLRATVHTAAPEWPIFLIAEGKHNTIYQPMHPDPDKRYLRDGNAYSGFIHGLEQVKAEWREREQEALKDDADYDTDDEDTKKAKRKAEKLEEVILFRDPADAFGPALMGYWCCWYNQPDAVIDSYNFNEISRCTNKVYQVVDNNEPGQKLSHETATLHLDLYNLELPATYQPDPDLDGIPIEGLYDYLTFYKKYDLEQLLKNALPYRFWEQEADYDGPRGQRVRVGWKYVFDNVQAYNFLNKMGFYRLPVEDRKTDYIFVRIEENKVYEVKTNDVKNFMHRFVKERALDKALRNTLYKSAQLNETSLSNLDETFVDFTYFDEDRQFLFFNNATWEVTAEGIKAYKPGDIRRYVWDHDVIPHKVKLVDPAFTINKQPDSTYDIVVHHTNDMFFNYLIQVSRIHWRKELEVEAGKLNEVERKQYLEDNKFKIDGNLLSPEERHEQKQHLINKIFAIGYLIHRQKDRARAWAVIAMDNRINHDGKSYGRSGKSILFNQALPEVLRNMHHIPGGNPDKTKDPHIFHGLNKYHQALIIDDADRRLEFRFFCEFITGDQVVNPKQNAPYTIAFNDLAKLVWLTNFSFKVDASFQGRVIYTVFSDYYHEKTEEDDFKESRSPKDDFGKSMITAFDEAEYNQFMNTMARCLQFALACPIKYSPPMSNVNKRNLLAEMGQNFEQWASLYFGPSSGNLDRMIIKDEAFQEFLYDQNLNKGSYTAASFKKSLKNFCLFHGYIFCPEQLINEPENNRITAWVADRKLDRGGNWPDTATKKSKELIYIQTDPAKPLNRVMPGDEEVKKVPF